MGGTVTKSKPVKHRKQIQDFRLIDDDFFNMVFQNNILAVELLLRIILDRTEINIVSVETQHFIKNLYGRSIRMDVYAVDECGVRYNIEVQRNSAEGKPGRARYYSSILDANVVPAGGSFPSELPKTYIIFITEHDVLGKGRPVYEVKRATTCGEDFEDGTHIIYVNGEMREETPIGRLMHDFFCVRASEMFYPELAEQVSYYKDTKDGVEIMSKIMEQVRAESIISVYRRRYHLTDEEIIERIVEDLSITKEDARAYVAFDDEFM